MNADSYFLLNTVLMARPCVDTTLQPIIPTTLFAIHAITVKFHYIVHLLLRARTLLSEDHAAYATALRHLRKLAVRATKSILATSGVRVDGYVRPGTVLSAMEESAGTAGDPSRVTPMPALAPVLPCSSLELLVVVVGGGTVSRRLLHVLLADHSDGRNATSPHDDGTGRDSHPETDTENVGTYPTGTRRRPASDSDHYADGSHEGVRDTNDSRDGGSHDKNHCNATNSSCLVHPTRITVITRQPATLDSFAGRGVTCVDVRHGRSALCACDLLVLACQPSQLTEFATQSFASVSEGGAADGGMSRPVLLRPAAVVFSCVAAVPASRLASLLRHDARLIVCADVNPMRWVSCPAHQPSPSAPHAASQAVRSWVHRQPCPARTRRLSYGRHESHTDAHDRPAACLNRRDGCTDAQERRRRSARRDDASATRIDACARGAEMHWVRHEDASLCRDADLDDAAHRTPTGHRSPCRCGSPPPPPPSLSLRSLAWEYTRALRACTGPRVHGMAEDDSFLRPAVREAEDEALRRQTMRYLTAADGAKRASVVVHPPRAVMVPVDMSSSPMTCSRHWAEPAAAPSSPAVVLPYAIAYRHAHAAARTAHHRRYLTPSVDRVVRTHVALDAGFAASVCTLLTHWTHISQSRHASSACTPASFVSAPAAATDDGADMRCHPSRQHASVSSSPPLSSSCAALSPRPTASVVSPTLVRLSSRWPVRGGSALAVATGLLMLPPSQHAAVVRAAWQCRFAQLLRVHTRHPMHPNGARINATTAASAASAPAAAAAAAAANPPIVNKMGSAAATASRTEQESATVSAGAGLDARTRSPVGRVGSGAADVLHPSLLSSSPRVRCRQLAACHRNEEWLAKGAIDARRGAREETSEGDEEDDEGHGRAMDTHIESTCGERDSACMREGGHDEMEETHSGGVSEDDETIWSRAVWKIQRHLPSLFASSEEWLSCVQEHFEQLMRQSVTDV